MTDRLFRAGVVCASLALGGCGGGASPIATAPPLVAPVAYSSFPLTAEQKFATTTSSRSYTGNLGIDPVTIGPTAVAQNGTVTIDYNPATDTYTLTDGMVSRSFGNSAKLGPAANPLPTTSYLTSSANGNDSLNVHNNVAGQSPGNLPFALTYLSYGRWEHGDGQTGELRTTWFVFGSPTIPSDMPRTGSASYSVAITGTELVYGSSIPGGATSGTQFGIGGSASLAANFDTGRIDTSISLHRIQLGADDPIGTLTGVGTISSGTSGFSGSFTSSDSPFGGSFAGGFYGPRAREVGYAFAVSGHAPLGAPGGDSNINGVVVGTKN